MRTIFITLPVRAPKRATAFDEAIGLSKNAAFSTHVASATRWAVPGAGGRETRAIEDRQFGHGGAFEDPDGHTRETAHMGMSRNMDMARNMDMGGAAPPPATGMGDAA